MQRRVALGIVTAFLLVALSACAGPPRTRFYLLEAHDVTNARIEGTGLPVAVERFVVDPPYDQDRLVYRVGSSSAEVGFYEYHRWAAPLGTMVPRVLTAALANDSRRLVPERPGETYAAHLAGRILAMEEVDTAKGQASRVRVDLRLLTTDSTELWHGTLEGSVTTQTRDVEDVVDGLLRALQTAASEARTEFGAALSALP